ncbi:MAG TPA: helix-hairpin-helix domain-containing protein [Candidatus Angelobacter sp.]|nr:helix-hairpin-helix domain-containing protein [Candidatus Angelobacter sp.]
MWGREMRAGICFVIGALLIGQGFREWKRTHERSLAELVRDLESEDARSRPTQAADSMPAAAPRRRAPPQVPVGRIDPNRASVAELIRLPGIGPSLAGRIVADRDQHGAFASPEALLRVRGIGPKTLDRIRGFLSFPSADGGDSLTGF